MRRGGARSPLPWLAGLLALYLGVPVVAFGVRLLATNSRGFHDAGLFPALAVSVAAATITTAVATLCGVPLAHLLARSKGRLAATVGLLVLLPLAVPPVMGGILLVYLVGPYTWLGRLFGGQLTGTLAGVVLAQTFVASPFLIVAARASLAAVDPALDEVAATLGHGALARFLRVDVAVASPGIRAGMVLTWLRAFGEYGATVVLAYHPTSLPVYTFTQFSATGLPGTMAPTALALGVAVVAVGLSRVALVRYQRRYRTSAVVVGSPRRPAPPIASPIGFRLDHRLGTFHLAVD
ncbi:MAG: ABC transporter permease subunit, partial [Acidimicrobiales bacterium]